MRKLLTYKTINLESNSNAILHKVLYTIKIQPQPAGAVKICCRDTVVQSLNDIYDYLKWYGGNIMVQDTPVHD
jgi:hypothetical protein